uniref:Myb/SANT-like domain-containing protein n=1 Tax=Glycine max TaxID=3847 RepID=A0A0R0K7T6_SOYBN
MERYDLQRQRRDMKKKGRNVVWSIAMDKCLIEALAAQARSGNKIDKCFNENAYMAACVAVNTCFNLNLNNQKVINRLKTIKKRYKVIKDILSQNGFWWNPNTEMIECDSDEIWKNYVAAHPDAKGFHGKQIEIYDELKLFAVIIKPQEALMTVASSIRHLVDAMEQSKCSFDASELLQAVMEIDGLEEGKQMYAFEYLNADPAKARAFLTYNARMRKTYLFRQFWWWR